MTKKELIKTLSLDLQTTIKTVDEFLNALENVVIDTLKYQDEVKFSRNLGKFVSKIQNSKRFYNIDTKQFENSTPKKVIKFVRSTKTKELLN